jgi:hypothetical protein
MKKMNEYQNNKHDIEDRLANFTDLILNEKSVKKEESPFAPDPELRALEETALRLKNTFRENGPSEAVIRRMQKNINREWQQQKTKESQSLLQEWISTFWPIKDKWQSQRSRQRVSMLLYTVTVLGLFLTSIFLYNGVYSDQPAASGQNLGAGLLVTFGGLVLFTIWFFRRKR